MPYNELVYFVFAGQQMPKRFLVLW